MMNKICIDFGGGNLKIHHNIFGLVFNEPTLIAAEKRGKKYAIIATGNNAEKLFTETKANQVVFSPIAEGVVQSVEYAAALLKRALNSSLNKKAMHQAHVMFCVPSGINTQEKQLFLKICKLCGFKNIDLADAPVAVLLGATELAPEEEVLVIDLGASKCDFQILKNFQIQKSATLGLGGNSIKNALKQTLWEEDCLWINNNFAHSAQKQLCTLLSSNQQRLEICGLHYPTGEELTKSISANQFFPLTKGFFDEVVLIGKTLMLEYQAQTNSRIKNILLSGGLAHTTGLEKFFLKNFSNTKIIITEDPEYASLRGLVKLLT